MNKHTINFDPETHTYTVDGEVKPSVSQILQEAGVSGGGFYTAGSAERGTFIHECTEAMDRNEFDWEGTFTLYPETRAWRGYLEAYASFLEKEKPVIIASEKLLYTQKYDYCGRLDRIIEGLGVVDIKTSAKLERWHGLQLAGYLLCTDETDRNVLQLCKDGSYFIKPYKDKLDIYGWMGCVNLASWKRAGKRKKKINAS